LQQAIALAKGCCERQPNNPERFDALGIVYAAARDFPRAMDAARRAYALAQAQRRTDLAAQIGARLQAYQAGRWP
jgi:Flp pilus assembly protein TadD